MNSILVKFTLVIVLAAVLASCAGAPSNPPANQVDDHIVQGGSFAGEGMLYFPLGLPNDKK